MDALRGRGCFRLTEWQSTRIDIKSSGAADRLTDAAKRAKDEGDLSQAEKFAQAARDLGADQDEEAFKGVLRKLAKSKT